MSAIRTAIAGILALSITALLPGISNADKNTVILPLADYTTMDSLAAARKQSQIINDALTDAITAKGLEATSQARIFTTLQNHKCITPLTYNKDLRPGATTKNLEDAVVNDTMTTHLQNELKGLISAEQKRMTPGLADPDNHLPKPGTTTLDNRQLAIIGGELGAEFVIRGRILVRTITKKSPNDRFLPTQPLRRSILPIFATIEQDEKYAVAASESYDIVDDFMLAGLFGNQTDHKQIVRMQLWAHDGSTGKPIWTGIKEVSFSSKNPKKAIQKISNVLIDDFWAQIAVDEDMDGVFDYRDKCPDTPRGISVDTYGCPTDSDADGVPDYLDKCPLTQPGVKVDAEGCPLDTDKDGADDYYDKCPDTPVGVVVDENGCPKDGDADGVPDYLDKCPNTPAGRKVDSNGCHKPIRRKISMEMRIEFDFDKTAIPASYQDHLQKIGDFLKTYPDITAEIEGHTDKEGTIAYNQKLSQRRAESVRQYLIDKFNIAPNRLTARGYGESKPLDNRSGRNAKNRRAVAVFSTFIEE